MKKYKLLTQGGYFHFTKGKEYEEDSFGDYHNSEHSVATLVKAYPKDWKEVITK